MDYSGPLFGKHGQHYVPLRMSAADVDELLEALEVIQKALYGGATKEQMDDLRVMTDSAIAKAKGAK